MMDRPKEWLETVQDLIRARFNYENCNKALKKRFGDVDGAISGQEYQIFKNKIDGGTQVEEKLDELGERKRAKPKPEKKPPAWSSGKQKTADSSKLAQIFNMGVYQGLMPFCESQQLTEEDVEEINPGGGIVATITYYFPGGNVDHPLIILAIRVVLLYVKFKRVCARIDAKVTEGMERRTLGKNPSGIKPEMRTEKHK